jgi:hypothetical protein
MDRELMGRIRSAKERGWVRRPELDHPTGDAWEQPDGALTMIPKGRAPVVAGLPRAPLTEADRKYLDWLKAKRRSS